MCNGRRFPRTAKHEGGPTPVARRVSPVERIRAEIDQLFGSDHDLVLILEDVARLSVRLVFQAALEAEVDAFLGRARYQRRDERGQPGSRNGHQPPMTVKTRWARSSWSAPSCAAPTRRSAHGCSAPG